MSPIGRWGEVDLSGSADEDTATERIDWLHTAGAVSGLALGVALDLVEGPVAVLLVATPLLRSLAAHRNAPRPVRAAGRLLGGLSVPLGGADGLARAARTLAAPALD